MIASNRTLIICAFVAKVFGCINIYPNAEKYSRKWWKNLLYRILIFLILVYALSLQSPVQSQLFYGNARIVSGKILVETLLYWSTLYISYGMMMYYHTEVDDWIKKCATLPIRRSHLAKNLKRHAILCLFFTVLKLSFYASAMTRSSQKNIQAMAAIGYFMNRFTVDLINLMFTFALYLMSSLYQDINSSLSKLKNNLTSARQTLANVRNDFRSLRQQWQQVAQLCEQLNKIFSTHIWLFTTLNLLETIYSCNQLVSLYGHCQQNEACLTSNLATLVLWLLNYCIPDAHMIHASTNLTYQSRLTSCFVTDLEMVSDGETLIQDLEIFSWELYLTKIEVTAGGCFLVNGGLFTSKGGTLITFFIILSEFQIQGDNTFYNGFSR